MYIRSRIQNFKLVAKHNFRVSCDNIKSNSSKYNLFASLISLKTTRIMPAVQHKTDATMR